MRLEGRKAIITGGGAGIGEAIARAFVKEGASIVIADMDLEAAENVATSLRDDGHTAHALLCDVSDGKSVQSMVEAAAECLGSIDTLVNNAGFGRAGKLLETTEEDWDRMMDVNVKGIFLVSKHTLPHLLESGGGCIINMASVAGVVGVRDRTAYCASKGGVISLTRAIALDYVEQGLRCNSISPGTVDTPWVGRMVAQFPDPEATRAQMVARQPMGRLGQPDEIAAATVYLASEDAAFITGSNMMIDGGMTMQ